MAVSDTGRRLPGLATVLLLLAVSSGYAFHFATPHPLDEYDAVAIRDILENPDTYALRLIRCRGRVMSIQATRAATLPPPGIAYQLTVADETGTLPIFVHPPCCQNEGYAPVAIQDIRAGELVDVLIQPIYEQSRRVLEARLHGLQRVTRD